MANYKIKEGDIVEYKINSKFVKVDIVRAYRDARKGETMLLVGTYKVDQVDIISVLPKEEYDTRKVLVSDKVCTRNNEEGCEKEELGCEGCYYYK